MSCPWEVIEQPICSEWGHVFCGSIFHAAVIVPICSQSFQRALKSSSESCSEAWSSGSWLGSISHPSAAAELQGKAALKTLKGDADRCKRPMVRTGNNMKLVVFSVYRQLKPARFMTDDLHLNVWKLQVCP